MIKKKKRKKKTITRKIKDAEQLSLNVLSSEILCIKYIPISLNGNTVSMLSNSVSTTDIHLFTHTFIYCCKIDTIGTSISFN